MRTTLNLDDEVMRAVKKEAAESGRTMTEIIEESLRETLLRRRRPRAPFRLQMLTVRGNRPPRVDITDREALYEAMEDRS